MTQSAAASLMGLLLAGAVHAQGPADKKPVVTIFDFDGRGDITDKEAFGVTVLMRKAVRDGDFATLQERKDDKKDAKKCKGHPSCLSRMAKERGIDFLVWGYLEEVEGDVVIVGEVYTKKDKGAIRTVREPMGLSETELFEAVERLAKKAVAPTALAGEVLVVGTEGALVLLDGNRVGTLPLDGPVTGVVEGEHQLEVKKKGYKTIKRRVDVKNGAVTEEEVLLTKALDREADPYDADAAEEGSDWGQTLLYAPWLLVGVGALVGASGVVVGVLSHFDAMGVKSRAERGQLIYPRDAALVTRGFYTAIIADVLMGSGVVMMLGGGAWFGVQFALEMSE